MHPISKEKPDVQILLDTLDWLFNLPIAQEIRKEREAALKAEEGEHGQDPDPG